MTSRREASAGRLNVAQWRHDVKHQLRDLSYTSHHWWQRSSSTRTPIGSPKVKFRCGKGVVCLQAFFIGTLPSGPSLYANGGQRRFWHVALFRSISHLTAPPRTRHAPSEDFGDITILFSIETKTYQDPQRLFEILSREQNLGAESVWDTCCQFPALSGSAEDIT